MIGKLRLAIRNDLEPGAESHAFGSGWISGVLALVLGGSSLLLLLGHQYPGWFSVKDLAPVQKSPLIVIAIQIMAFAAFALACINMTLRRNKVLGFSAMALVLITTSLGALGAQKVGGDGWHFGVDWFILNLLLKAMLFVPLEKLFGRVEQPLFRTEWREDLFYFLVSAIFVQTLAFLSLAPSMAVMAHTTGWGPFRALVASQPVIVQFIEIMLISDIMQYVFHRAFHQVPWLWEFHAVHHSARTMDWLASSRMHVVEIVLLRGISIIPMYALGFAQAPLYAYIFFVFLIATLVHANVRFKDGWIAAWFVTPRFHHWHHGIEKEAIDVNFAVHFPWIDRLFGTYYLPGNEWPSGYGIGGHPVPQGFWKQFLYPFRRREKAPTPGE